MQTLLSRSFRISAFVLLLPFALPAASQQAEPAWYAARARELEFGGRALILSYAPSQEDLRSAVVLRQTRGAHVHFGYLTNGEAFATDPQRLYPHQLAAALRGGAAGAADSLEAGHTFLNLPHLDAVADPQSAARLWPSDTLQARLLRLLSEVRPDLVLIGGFEDPATPRPVEALFRAVLSEVLSTLRSGGRVIPDVVAFTDVPRAVESTTNRRSLSTKIDPVDAKLEIVRSAYGWLARPELEATRSYTTLAGYPRDGFVASSDVSRLLRKRRPRTIARIDSVVGRLAKDVARWPGKRSRSVDDRRIRALVNALGTIDEWTDANPSPDPLDRRILLDWRRTLEAVRLRVLGVAAYIRISDSVLTPRQLTYLTIDSVHGLDPKGRTEVFFPKAKERWILNERPGDRAALVIGQPYRLVSPLDMPLDIPRDLEGLERPEYRSPWYYYIVHWATRSERSFSLRMDAGILGAQRFITEVLTPVVTASSDERLAIQLTNHSRDGVRDSLRVASTHVRSKAVPFRLHAKGMSTVDTLSLTFDEGLADGVHLLPVSIGREPVSRFVVRKFSIRADSIAPVLLVSRDERDATSMAIRRLGVRARRVAPEAIDTMDLGAFGVMIVAEQAAPHVSAKGWARVSSSIEGGLRAVVLWQPATALGVLPGDHRLRATTTADLDTSVGIRADTSDRLFSGPNDLRVESWDGWLFRRSSTQLTTNSMSVTTVARFDRGDQAAVVRWDVGKGSVTYVNLNLGHQFLNVLPSAYRLLANLLAS